MAAAKGGGARGKGEDRTIEDDIDALFQLPLAEFTAARNALAARLKKAGNAEKSAELKALGKPPLSAWTVNQLYWRERDAFDRLMTTGQQFRAAQASQLSGKPADLRAPLDARRTSLSELSRKAAALLRAAGHSPTPDTMRRITTTLEALSTYGDAGPRPGRLSDDVDPPGFEALAALVPTVGQGKTGGAPTRIIPFQQRARKDKRVTPSDADERAARLAAAKAAVAEAERALSAAQKSAHTAEAALKQAAARAKELEKIRAEAEQRLEKAAAAADAARQQARRVAADAEEAAQALEDAERALEKAARELKTLS